MQIRVEQMKHSRPSLTTRNADPSSLIEHSKGFACCSIIRTVRNRILMRSLDLPFAQVELELERDVRILGAIDLELRPLVSAQDLGIAADLTEYWKPEPLGPPPPTLRLGRSLLLKARSQAHFRSPRLRLRVAE